MRTPKIIIRPWQVLKCQDGHPLYIATKELTDFLPVSEVTTYERVQYPLAYNYFDVKNFVRIGKFRLGPHNDRYTCHCGSKSIQWNQAFDDYDHLIGWWVTLLYKRGSSDV